MRFIVKSLLHINSVLAVAEDVVLLPSVSPVFVAIVETVVAGIVGVLNAADADATATDVDAMAVVSQGVSIAFIFLCELTLSVGCICTPSTGGTPAAGRLNGAYAIFVPFVIEFASIGDAIVVVVVFEVFVVVVVVDGVGVSVGAIVVVVVVVSVHADVSAARSETNEFDVCGTFDLLQY